MTNRPDSYSTSYSTSRGSVNCPDIRPRATVRVLLEPPVTRSRLPTRRHVRRRDGQRTPCISLDKWRWRSVNLLGILLRHQPHVARASRQAVAAANVPDML